MIELTQLEYLCAFVEYGTLTKAAEELHMSQPALTRSMQKLEDELGVTLFDRQKNRISLTETGKVAADYAQSVLNSAENMVTHVRNFDLSQKTINLGICAPMPMQAVPSRISRLYPHMRIASKMESDTDKLEQELQDGTYDLIVLPYKPEGDNLVMKQLMDEQLYFLLPKKDPLSVASGLHLSNMDGHAILLYTDIGFWRKYVDEKMPNTTFILQNSRDSFQQIVNSSDLPSFYSSTYLGATYPDGKVPIRILDPEMKVTYYAAALKGKGARKVEKFLKSK